MSFPLLTHSVSLSLSHTPLRPPSPSNVHTHPDKSLTVGEKMLRDRARQSEREQSDHWFSHRPLSWWTFSHIKDRFIKHQDAGWIIIQILCFSESSLSLHDSDRSLAGIKARRWWTWLYRKIHPVHDYTLPPPLLNNVFFLCLRLSLRLYGFCVIIHLFLPF